MLAARKAKDVAETLKSDSDMQAIIHDLHLTKEEILDLK